MMGFYSDNIEKKEIKSTIKNKQINQEDAKEDYIKIQ